MLATPTAGDTFPNEGKGRLFLLTPKMEYDERWSPENGTLTTTTYTVDSRVGSVQACCTTNSYHIWSNVHHTEEDNIAVVVNLLGKVNRGFAMKLIMDYRYHKSECCQTNDMYVRPSIFSV